ncbi:MAG TPA: SHOCT domain-containing protein [Actinomycetota bacterium]|nr:SHOCT domain-containing protein [Actinomycetota bacterium]
MPTLAHFGPDMVDRPWWGTFGWLMPLLMLLLLAGVTVWAVARLTSERRLAVAGPATPLAPPDAALERARMRYASGEMTRDEFVRLSRDLGAPLDGEESNDG